MRLLASLLALTMTLDFAASQNAPPPPVEWLTGKQREAALAKQSTWLPLLDRSTLSIGRYRLRAGGKDGQSPHDQDEVYFVVAGKGQFTAAGETRDISKGDLVFVAAKATHRFHDVTEDLDLLVMFSSAVPITGGMVAAPPPTEQTPFPENSPRGATRIFYWFGPDSAGQVAMQYGRARWKQQYAQFLSKPSGQRWRCGENFWTTLDTNMPLVIGGTKGPIGLYYVAMQNDKQRGLELVLLDPQQIRKQRLDAYEVTKTTGGLIIPLKRSPAQPSAGRLSIELTVTKKERDRGALEISFGGNLLRADVVMHPHRK